MAQYLINTSSNILFPLAKFDLPHIKMYLWHKKVSVG